VDIDLTVQRVETTTASGDTNQVIRAVLQSAAEISLGDWFEFTVGPASMDLTAAPYGGARYPVEARTDERTFARFHLDAGVGDVVMATSGNDRVPGLAGIRRNRIVARPDDRSQTAVSREDSCLHAPAERGEQQGEGLSGPGSSDRIR